MPIHIWWMMSSERIDDLIGRKQKIDGQPDSIGALLSRIDRYGTSFDQRRHDSESRLRITTLFLKWFFSLILFSFLFSAAYNFVAAWINTNRDLTDKIPLLDVSNTVSIVTTTLSSGVGFVIGYYFKNKEDR